MVNELILAVDIGTSAAKAVLFDERLNLVSLARQPYPIHTPYRGWSEQDPDVLVSGVRKAMGEAVHSLPGASQRVRGITFSSQMYSVMAVSPNGKPLTHSLTWADTRSAGVVQNLKKNPKARQAYQRTGCPLDSIYPLPKIIWLKEHSHLPEHARFISVKDYVIHWISHQFITDWSSASATGLMDINRHTWDPDVLSLIELEEASLPRLVSPRKVIDGRPGMLEEVGLPSKIPIVVGGGDGPLASLGVSAYSPDILAVNVGTSAAARCLIGEPLIDPQGGLWTYIADEDLWALGGIVSSGGMVYDWFLRNFWGDLHGEDISMTSTAVHKAVEQYVRETQAGSEGLMFLPFLGGEQSPDWRPETRGAFVGLDFRHGRGHLARAVLEGMGHSIYRVVEALRSVLDRPFREVRMTGGLVSLPVWSQIVADLFDLPVIIPESVEGSARGAALLGWIALGRGNSPQDFPMVSSTHPPIQPHSEMHAFYQEQHNLFIQMLERFRQVEDPEMIGKEKQTHKSLIQRGSVQGEQES
jgi:gluconokinase